MWKYHKIIIQSKLYFSKSYKIHATKLSFIQFKNICYLNNENIENFQSNSHQSLEQLISHSSVIELRNTNIGFGLFAKKNFKEGEMIFIDNPFVSIPYYKNRNCNHCLKPIDLNIFCLPSGKYIFMKDDDEPPNSLIRHPQVKRTIEGVIKKENNYYCSTECSLESFSLKGIENLETWCIEEDIGYIPLLTMKVIYKVLSSGGWEGNNGKFILSKINKSEEILVSSEELDIIKTIMPNLNLDLYKNLRYMCSQNAAELEVQSEYLSPISLSSSQNLLNPEFYNCFTQKNDKKNTTDKLMTEKDSPLRIIHSDGKQYTITSEFPSYGIFLPYIGSFLNHSCNCNVSISHSQYNHQSEYIAMRNIEMGEELTISYIPVNISFHERRVLLYDGWGFFCECPLCLSEEENEKNDN